MKTTKVLQAVSLLLILIIAVSCRSNRSTTGRQYPRTPQTETPTRTYPGTPQSETPTKTGPVIVTGTNLPPGQAKKVYGGQSAKPYAPGQRKKYAHRHPLVIVYSPAIVISQHTDGRHYYRNTAGYIYWKGSDGRYYLDEKHLKGMDYEVSEYDDWKSKGQKNNKSEPKAKEQEEKVKENHKEKVAEPIAKVKEQKGNGQDEKVKDNDQKGNDQADQKGKDNNSQKGKGKSKEKG